MRKDLERRRFLQAAAGLLAAPLLVNGRRPAHAQNKPPLRFLGILETYGVPVDERSRLWTDSRVGDYALEESHLGTLLQPLAGHLDKLLILSGANHRPANASFDLFHHGGVFALTGSKATSNEPSGRQQNASLDYVIGKHLNGDYGLDVARPHAHLFVSDTAQPDKLCACAGEGGVPIRSIAGYKNVQQTLFADIATDQSGIERLALDRESRELALSLAQSRIVQLRPQLVQANASQVLDAYESSVRELAAQLESAVDRTCSPPEESAAALADNDGRVFPEMLNTIFHSFACDLTSSVLYTIGGEVESFQKHAFLADPSQHSEATVNWLGQNAHASTHGNTPDEQMCQEVTRAYQIQKVADLVDRLSVTPDVGGGMMIDNTVIFLQSSLSNNTHVWGDFCNAIIAGKNTNLVGGYHYDLSGSSINDVLATVGQGLTVPLTEFGGRAVDGSLVDGVNNGPIERMLKEVFA